MTIRDDNGEEFCEEIRAYSLKQAYIIASQYYDVSAIISIEFAYKCVESTYENECSVI